MRLRRAIEKRYTDRAEISRMENYETDKGETRQRHIIVYEDVPCRISQKALGVNSQRDTFNEIYYETKLFMSPAIVVLQGDTIEVTRGGVGHLKSYAAGEPFPYVTHQEISLQRKGKA